MCAPAKDRWPMGDVVSGSFLFGNNVHFLCIPAKCPHNSSLLRRSGASLVNSSFSCYAEETRLARPYSAI